MVYICVQFSMRAHSVTSWRRCISRVTEVTRPPTETHWTRSVVTAHSPVQPLNWTRRSTTQEYTPISITSHTGHRPRSGRRGWVSYTVPIYRYSSLYYFIRSFCVVMVVVVLLGHVFLFLYFIVFARFVLFRLRIHTIALFTSFHILVAYLLTYLLLSYWHVYASESRFSCIASPNRFLMALLVKRPLAA